jgi:iron complex transport system ATP-binding protein
MRIEISNVSFTYERKPTLAGVSATADEGSLTGIIGPNGSGKSTLLRIMGGILKPLSGSVMYDGVSISSMPPMRAAKVVGAVLQDTGAQFGFAVREIVEMGRFPYLGLMGKPTKADGAAVSIAMEMAGVASFANRSVSELSSGERQRVYIARALAQEPAALLLDEPTSHLDISYQFEIMEMLKSLTDLGKAVVIVMHDLNLAGLYCDRILALKHGIVAALGVPDDVLTSENILEIYGVKAIVENHPSTSRPGIVMLSPSSRT